MEALSRNQYSPTDSEILLRGAVEIPEGYPVISKEAASHIRESMVES